MDEKKSSLDNDSTSKRTCLNYGPEVTLSVGCLSILFGLSTLYINDKIFEYFLRKELSLRPHSKSYEIWHKTPVPVTLEFYFFNWTNPDELGIKKPAFTETGPYRFIEQQYKTNITWNYDNDTVTYMRKKFWYYDEENSFGNINDEITTLNPVALTAAHTVRDWNYLLQKSVSMGLSTTGQKISITKTVREFLFDGYEDKLLNFARSMPSFKGLEIPFDKFGWFYTRNGTSEADGLFNMETGGTEIKNIGILRNWNNANHTPFYKGECSEIRGSAGEFWPPGRNIYDPVNMYSPDLCRSISLKYARNSTVSGLTGYTFILDKEVLDNGSKNSENLCYCNGECSYSGVINSTSCHFGAPGFISYPHFYLADPYYLNAVDGMKPDPDKHQFYITLEPNMGIPLDVAARLQINLLLQPNPNIALYKNVPKIYFPMLWFDERATMPQDMANSLMVFLNLPFIILLFGVFLIVCGTITALISSVVIWLRKCRRKSGSCYNDNIINVQLSTCEPHARSPLMEKVETPFNKSVSQSNKLVA